MGGCRRTIAFWMVFCAVALVGCNKGLRVDRADDPAVTARLDEITARVLEAIEQTRIEREVMLAEALAPALETIRRAIEEDPEASQLLKEYEALRREEHSFDAMAELSERAKPAAKRVRDRASAAYAQVEAINMLASDSLDLPMGGVDYDFPLPGEPLEAFTLPSFPDVEPLPDCMFAPPYDWSYATPEETAEDADVSLSVVNFANPISGIVSTFVESYSQGERKRTAVVAVDVVIEEAHRGVRITAKVPGEASYNLASSPFTGHARAYSQWVIAVVPQAANNNIDTDVVRLNDYWVKYIPCYPFAVEFFGEKCATWGCPELSPCVISADFVLPAFLTEYRVIVGQYSMADGFLGGNAEVSARHTVECITIGRISSSPVGPAVVPLSSDCD